MPEGLRNWKKELLFKETGNQTHTHVVETQSQSLVLICVHDKWSNSRREAHGHG